MIGGASARRSRLDWAPTLVLGLGVLMTAGADRQRSMPLESSLESAVPMRMAGMVGQDVEISADEQRVAGMDAYLMREYTLLDAESAEDAGWVGSPASFSIYVGYYESQTQGRTIHSPRNCLPGAGWTPLASRRERIQTGAGPITVNRYLLQYGEYQALVLYWYQGRGRVEADEYRVKWDLLRDAALRGRTEEALVRITVPVTASEEEAFRLAAGVAEQMVPAVEQALPD